MRLANALCRRATGPATSAVTLVSVKTRLRAVEVRPGDTTLLFKHYVPDLGGQHAQSRYLLTTDPLELTEAVWATRARAMVNTLAGEDRGRAVFCVDRIDNLVMAAIAVHFEKRTEPFHVRAIAERQDPRAAQSAECVRLLKRCLHLFSLALGGDGELYYDAPTGEQAARARTVYEFRNAPRLARSPGGDLLIQDPPPDV